MPSQHWASGAEKLVSAARRRVECTKRPRWRTPKGAESCRASAGEPSNEPATVLGPLPAGRHGMTRATVRHSQRERLLAGALETVAERGYAETRIGDVVARAAVSRRAFYESFESVEECFLCAAEIVAGHLGEIATAAAAGAEAGPPGRTIAGLRAILDFLADEPNLAGLAWWNLWRWGRLANAPTAKRSTRSRRRSERISGRSRRGPFDL
jgi:tetracycline repressor-like protein